MSRYERLNGFLASDPANLSLLSDAAAAAYEEGRPADALALIARHEQLAPTPPHLTNLRGLCALAEGQFAEAAQIFAGLLSDNPDDAGLRFNLAWAYSRLGEPQAALDALGEGPDTAAAAALAVRSLHHLGRLEEAVSLGDRWAGREGAPDLWGALASAALDHEDLDRAASWAALAPETPDGLAALGMLAFADGEETEAEQLFERALALRPDFARGRLGLGAALLNNDQPKRAAEQFDAAADIFGDHLGSWVAAGWAWLVAGDLVAARSRFDRALALDDAFGEAHGGLAVLDLMEGRNQDAARRAETALRLDRKGLGGTLARSLMLEQAGDGETAARIRDLALNTPVGPRGQSIAQVLAARSARGG